MVVEVDNPMWIDAEFRPVFERAGWSTFEAVMLASEGQCWRLMAQRENWRFELVDNHGQLRCIYLKKHHHRTWRSWLRAKLKLPPSVSPARLEMQLAEKLRQAGIETMRVVAFGELLRSDGRFESFLATEELTGFVELRDFILRRFPLCPHRITWGRDADLDRLVAQAAELVGAFHRAGYNHRDLYSGHIFVREPAKGQFEFRLIDLQRVQYRRHFRRRWLVKDLAQLAWSLSGIQVYCRHRLAFFRQYLKVERLRPCDKRFAREIIARQQRMQRKLGDIETHSRPFER